MGYPIQNCRLQPPRQTGALGRDGRFGGARCRIPPLIAYPLDLARRLDREADAELGMGHHAAAERLATRAAELRGFGA